MFVPRQLQHHTAGHPAPLPKSRASSSVTTPQAPHPRPLESSNTQSPKPEIDPTNAKEIVLSLGQLLGSFNPHTQWLEERRRSVDGHDDYIHFAGLLDCPFFTDTKPVLSQVLLRRALTAAPSSNLQISSDGYHVRYIGNRAQLFDESTVYIEPSSVGITTHPGRVARTLASTLPDEFLPVLYSECGDRSWGLVTLSANITEEQTHPSSGIWPDNWMVLTKAEWLRRDAQYRKHREAAQRVRQAAHLEERMAKMELDSPSTMPLNHNATSPATEDYEKGLIVHIRNLDPGVNKPTISSFIDRAVDRHIRKEEKKAAKAAGRLKEYKLERKDQPSKKKTMVYIDYKKGATEAWVRQITNEDSELIVQALEKRRRKMRDSEDRKGAKIAKDSSEGYVSGKILSGREEAAYWDTIRYAKENRNTKKSQEKARKGSPVADNQAGHVHGDVRPKRPRQSSNGDSLAPKKTRYDEDST